MFVMTNTSLTMVICTLSSSAVLTRLFGCFFCNTSVGTLVVVDYFTRCVMHVTLESWLKIMG
jgi:hypothetical protein